MARRIRLWPVLGTLFACAILLGTMAVVNAGALGSAGSTLTPAQGSALVQNAISKLKTDAQSALDASAFAPVFTHGLGVASVRQMVENLLGPQYAYLAASAPPALWSSLVAVSEGSPHGVSVASALSTDTGGLDGLLGGLFLGESAILVGACVAAAILTIGIGCVAILAGVALAAIVLGALGFFCSAFGWGCQGGSTAPQEQKAANDLAIVMLGDAGYAADIQAQAMLNELQALNLTYVALSYEASAAALSQLPNGTFSGGLDLSQGGSSSVAAQLSSVWFADATTVYSGILAHVLTQFSSEEGYGNGYGYYCPVQIGGTVIPYGTQYGVASPGAVNCAASTPDPVYWAEGLIAPAMAYVQGEGSVGEYANCPEVYIAYGSQITSAVETGGAKLNFYPVDGAPLVQMAVPEYGPSGTSSDAAFGMNFTGPSGGYWACLASTDSPSTSAIYITDSMPLNASTATFEAGVPHAQGAGPSGVWDQGGPNAVIAAPSGEPAAQVVAYPGPMAMTLYNLGTDGGPWTISLAGGNTNGSEYAGTPSVTAPMVGVQGNLMAYLYHLAALAETVGQTYWAFLRALGYTAESQVPIRCIIPSPASLIPPNVGLSFLESMNVTTMLNWYLTELYDLGETFNLSYALTDATFCDHTLPKWTNGGMGFGTFALGYVYVPSATKSSDGLVAQKYGTPSTYNISGEIFIAPALGNYSIPLDQRFLLGEDNPAALFVQPLTKPGPPTDANVVVNRTAPIWCASHVSLGNGNTTYGFTATGCNASADMAFVTGLVAGNSSTDQGLTGSVWPAGVDPSVRSQNISVYLTGCFMAKEGTPVQDPAWVFTTSGNCGFSDAVINNTGLNCNGNVLYSGGQIIGQCVAPPPVLVLTNENCGLSFLSVLAGYFSVLGATWSCVVAWAIFIVIVIAVIAVIFWVVRIVREGA